MSKIQNLAEYQQLAKRTCPSLGTMFDNERHMTLGVATEIGEALDIFKKKLAYKKPMDIVNLGEELADIAWYIVNLATFNGVEIKEDLSENLIAEFQEYLERVSKIDMTDDAKAEVTLILLLSYFCGSSVSFLFESVLVQLVSLAYICNLYKLDFFQCLTNNIDKLKVRYPEKFTEKAALNRDLDSERKELEKE